VVRVPRKEGEFSSRGRPERERRALILVELLRGKELRILGAVEGGGNKKKEFADSLSEETEGL